MSNTEIYQELFRLGPDAVIVVNDKGQIIMANDRMIQVFGYSKEELDGKMIEVLIPDRFRQLHVKHREYYHQNPVMRSMGEGRGLVARRKDGSEFFVEISLSPVNIDNERLIMAAVRDVTEKTQLNQQLQQSLDTIEKKNMELERFAYVASHDLQEPLRTIISLVRLLVKEYGESFDENANEYIQLISHTTGRMSALIKDLLEYSRLGQEHCLETIDCNELVASVLDDMAAQIKSTQATFEIGKLPVLETYPTIRQLFQNLISNALKFHKTGVNPHVSISAERNNGWWSFAVKDNGIGIEAGNEKKIFQIFTRLHSQNEFKGTGIGLAQCQKIVDMLGGKIWVNSREGIGSTFYFTIPVTN